jgi:ubiquinone/menaquinone biosynthesis methyltransferase
VATDQGIYEPAYVRRLFDQMARTYGAVNLVSSFGFAVRWRRQCVRRLPLEAGGTVVDLMTGMGELCPDLARRLGPAGVVRAVDLSPEMCARARDQARRCPCRVDVIEADALAVDLPAASADAVASSFGLKTFSDDQLAGLAARIERVLKPGGSYSVVEISVPPNRWLRWPYLFYVNRVIPLIGRAFLGNPDNYRMLGTYTGAFGDCRRFEAACRRAGLVAHPASYFFGCATGVFGHKPAA